MSELERLIEELRQNGSVEYASWSNETFDNYIRSSVEALQNQLRWKDKTEIDTKSVVNFLRMVAQGIGGGWLNIMQDGTLPTTFLAHAITSIVPFQLAEVPKAERVACLSRVWNLGEGLAKEPMWLNQYVIARTNWAISLQTLDQHIANILTQVLSPQPPATWEGNCQLQLLNLRDEDDAFVPGRCYLAAPSLLCIEHREDEKKVLALLLQRNGNSELLGQVPPLPKHIETCELPAIRSNGDSIWMGQRRVEVPFLSALNQAFPISSGFVAVTAMDSQNLWLVESA